QIRPVAQQMRDANRAAEIRDALNVVVAGLGRVLAGVGIAARIERGVIEDEAESAVIEAGETAAIIAERCRLRKGGTRTVVDGAVDEQTIGRFLTRILRHSF